MRIGLMTPSLNVDAAIRDDLIGIWTELRRRSDDVFLFTAAGSSDWPTPVHHYEDCKILLTNPEDLLIYYTGPNPSEAPATLRASNVE